MRLFILSVFTLVFAACSHSSKKQDIQIPPMKEVVLENGLKVILVKNQKLPLVSASLIIAPGASTDPKGKGGLTYLTAELIDKGTKSKSAEQLSDAFAQLGTSFRQSVDTDYIVFGTESLNYNQDQLLELFAEVITQPRFASSEYSLLKKRLLAALQKNLDEPSYVANYVYEKSLMGEYIYSRPTQGTVKDVNAIRLSQVKDHYKKLFTNQNATLVLAGDWSDDVLKKVTFAFKNWEGASQQDHIVAVSTEFPDKPAKLLLATKPGLKQAQIRMGHKGIKRNNPDYWSLQVANVILGGNFSSRLMREVRVKRGLTYGISSRFEAAKYEGPYTISTFTRFDKIAETLEASKMVVEQFKKEGVSSDEVNRAKNYLKGHLIRAYENPEDIVMTLLRLKLYGLSEEEVTQVLDRVNSVSASKVNAAIKKYYHPDNFVQVIYAPEEYQKDLKSMGDLQVKKASSFF